MLGLLRDLILLIDIALEPAEVQITGVGAGVDGAGAAAHAYYLAALGKLLEIGAQSHVGHRREMPLKLIKADAASLIYKLGDIIPPHLFAHVTNSFL